MDGLIQEISREKRYLSKDLNSCMVKYSVGFERVHESYGSEYRNEAGGVSGGTCSKKKIFS